MCKIVHIFMSVYHAYVYKYRIAKICVTQSQKVKAPPTQATS